MEGTSRLPRVVPLPALIMAESRTIQAVVPSMRVDAIGAKAFKVSRSYFVKGIANGSVTVNGKKAGKSAEVNVGDEVIAHGLGSMKVLSVDGETRRGNLKVSLEVARGTPDGE